MKFSVQGLGAWGWGMPTWSDMVNVLNGERRDQTPIMPAPQLIPARERRRAPTSVRLAVEIADQACRDAEIDPATLPSIFAMGAGDCEITDYMCRELAGEQKLLSPTKFHNSVHNAASGYWTISTGAQHPANAVSAHHYTVPMALMEAVGQALDEQTPILLAMYDVITPHPIDEVIHVSEPFGLAMVIAPGNEYSLDIGPSPTDWPVVEHPDLAQLATNSPMGRGISLAALLAGHVNRLKLPINTHQHLNLERIS